MKKKLIIIGICLFVLAALSLFAYLYYTRLSSFTCDKNCTGNSNLEFRVTIDKLTKKLTIEKNGKDYFIPSLPDELQIVSQEQDNRDDIYQKDDKILAVKLTSYEYKKVKELYDLNDQSRYRDSAPFMSILLDLVYNNAEYFKNDVVSNYSKYDKNNDKKITYREVANSMFDTYIKYYKENDFTSPNSNKILLSEFKCKTGKNSCTKNVTINYNKKTHKIKIKYYYKTDSDKVSTYYDLYIDGKKIDETKAMEYVLLRNENDNASEDKIYIYQDELDSSLDFGGYLLVFDNNIGFLKDIHISEDMSKAMIDIYSNNKKIGDTINLDENFVSSYMKVNEKSLTFTYPVCNKEEIVNVDFSVKNKTLNFNTISSKVATEDEKPMLIDSNYCYNTSENKIKLQNLIFEE